MLKKCLMIKMKNQKKFFTSEKNLPKLKEFLKTFDAEIYLVKVNDDVILDIETLISALCENQDIEINYELIK